MSARAATTLAGTTLVGTGRMLGLALRRERLRIPLWFGITGIVVAGVAAGIVRTYPAEHDRAELARSVARSVGELFLIGPVAGSSAGDVALWRIQGIAAIFTGLAAVLAVVRSTRTPEEDGGLELLGSARIGRAAPVLAAVLVAASGSLLTGLVTALGFVGLGAGAGSFVVGVQVVLFGLVIAGTTAVAAQLVRSARATTGVGIALVAVFYLLRGAGDAIGGSAFWLSPFGWIDAVSPFSSSRPGMLVPPLLLAVVLAGIATALAARRDLGAGALPDRAGRAHAAASLRGPISLALRIARPSIVGGAIGSLLVGLLIGGVAATVNRQVSLEVTGVTGGRGLAPVGVYLIAMFAAAAGILGVLQLRGEVTSGRADAVLARAVGRGHWLLAFLLSGALSAVVVTVAFGLGVGIVTPGMLGPYLLAGVGRAAAALVFVGLAGALVALAPRTGGVIAWVVLAAYLALELVVEFGIVPATILVLSPFALAPQLPDGAPNLPTTVLLLVIAVLLGAVGSRAVRVRDVI